MVGTTSRLLRRMRSPNYPIRHDSPTLLAYHPPPPRLVWISSASQRLTTTINCGQLHTVWPHVSRQSRVAAAYGCCLVSVRGGHAAGPGHGLGESYS